MINSDRRVKKTKTALKSALVKMLMEHDLSEISVSKLSEQADINRGTFYLHYQTVPDLFKEIEDEILNDFYKMVQGHDAGRPSSIINILDPIFDYIVEHADVLVVFLHTNQGKFLQRAVESLKPQIKNGWVQLFGDLPEDKYEYYYCFLTNGAVEVIRKWVLSGMKEDVKEMVDIVSKVMIGCIQSIIIYEGSENNIERKM